LRDRGSARPAKQTLAFIGVLVGEGDFIFDKPGLNWPRQLLKFSRSDASKYRGWAVPRGVASAKQLAMMARVLDTYCGTYHVTDSIQREDAAAVILELFNLGSRDEEALLAELEKTAALTLCPKQTRFSHER